MLSKIKLPLIVYASWYLIILLFQIFLQPIYKYTSESATLYQRLYLSWIIYWDSGHYVTIAEKGYNFPQQAFFPLWPLIIKIFSLILGYLYSSFILSIIFSLTTFILFYLLCKKLLGENNAKYSLILLASFPSTMFLHAGYTEGLFLTLTLLSFLLLEQKRYLLSSLVAGLGSMTRIIGTALAGIYLFINQPIKKRLIYSAISLLGLLAYIFYLQIYFGDGFLFTKALKTWCLSAGRCEPVFPLFPLINYTRLFLIGWLKPNLSFMFLDWFFSCLFIIFLIPVFKKLKINYFIYAVAAVFLPLTSSTVGMVRYVLVAFPVFFVAPQIIKPKILFFIICFLLFLLELRFVALFTNRIWVA